MKISLICLIVCLIGSGLFGEIVPLDSEEGRSRLQRSSHLPFLGLQKHYETQLKNYCGVASSIIVLNTLGIVDDENQVYTQDSFFTNSVLEIISPETVSKQGFAFEELANCLKQFPQLSVETLYGDEFQTPDHLATRFTDLLNAEGLYIITNFNRTALGQSGGGHYSPLAAIDEASRSVLILDVNERYGPFWVDIDHFWQSIQRIDDKRNFPRGCILCSKLQLTN